MTSSVGGMVEWVSKKVIGVQPADLMPVNTYLSRKLNSKAVYEVVGTAFNLPSG